MRTVIWVFTTFGFKAGVRYVYETTKRLFRKKELVSHEEALELDDADLEDIQVHTFTHLN
jgi:hypothetical protein